MTTQPPITQHQSELPRNQRITQQQAQALTYLTHTLRPDWDPPGITNAIRALAPHINPTHLSIALLSSTRHHAAKTPNAIHYPGPWWPQTPHQDTTRTQPDPCPIEEHARIGKHAHNCPECRLLHNFPPQIDAATYQQLHPKVQQLIDRSPTTIVLS